MEEREVFVSKDYVAKFVCPKCQASSGIDVSKGTEGKVEVDILCRCGQEYSVVVNRRRFPRKQVSLTGVYFKEVDNKKLMTVRVLSRNGLMFDLAEEDELTQGDQVTIEVLLQDHPMMLRKEVTVKTVSGPEIGVEFTTKEPLSTYEKYCETALALYIMKATLKPGSARS